MRRISEILYTLAFFVCGIWAVVSGTGTLFNGLNDISMTGTWACAVMVIVTISLKILGDIGNMHTKTLFFIGLTALFGGIWGIGTILIILAGIVMINRGFKQLKVLKELTSIRELRQIRKEKLEEVKDEGRHSPEETDIPKKPSVSEELLEGFVGSADYRQEIKTWIDKEEFEKEELTPDEIRAKAKQELRENKLSLETLLALEALDTSYGSTQPEEKDLTNVSLDLKSDEESEEDAGVSYTDEGDYSEESEDGTLEEDSKGLTTPEDMMGMSIEDMFGD